MRTVYFHPYMWQGYYRGPHDDRSHSEIGSADLSKARWIAIIDEFANVEDWEDYNNTYDQPNGVQGLMSRRVVEMNPAGYVLRDRLWQFTEEGPIVTGGGLGEQHVYATVEQYFNGSMHQLPPAQPEPASNPNSNDHPRLPVEDDLASLRNELLLVEHRSVGWSAGELESTTPGQSPGLLSFYDYTMLDGEDGNPEPNTNLPWSQRLKLVSEGIRRGNDSGATPKLYKRQMFYGVPYAQTVQDVQVEFLTPRTLPLASPPALESAAASQDFDYKATYTITEKRDPQDSTVPPMQWPVSGRMVVGPPRQVRPGSDWYYPVEREFYDDLGNPKWSATGLLRDPYQPQDPAGEHNSIILTHFYRDETGQARYTIADASTGPVSVPDGEWSVDGLPPYAVPEFPADSNNRVWARVPDESGLNYVTAFGYDSYGLSDTYFPNGRRWARRTVRIQDPLHDPSQGVAPFIARVYTFNNLQRTDENDPYYTQTLSPGEIKDYARPEPTGSPRRTLRVIYPEVFQIFAGGVSHDVPHEELWRIQLGIDSNGRIARADLLEASPSGQMLSVGTRLTNDLGEVLREEEIDGTITRTTRSPLGHALRRYVGTDDADFESAGGVGNMVLLDRTEYGTGLHDAWLPTITRQYTRQPEWAGEPFGSLQQADLDGIATVTRYDWRMRPVRVESYVQGDPGQLTPAQTTSTTLTILDHIDRPVLVVSYGAGGPGVDELPPALEPTKLIDDAALPSPRDYFGLSWRPVSVVSMRYGPDGSLIERRTYDVAWTPTSSGGEVPYQTEITHYAQGGAEVFAQRPGQPVTLKELDGVGRVVSVRSVVPDAGSWSYELSRTDYVHDADGNVVESIRWERIVNDTAAALSPANAVRSRTLSWFDVEKRLIATADLGTEQPDNVFIAGTSSFQRPNEPPASTDPTLVPGMPAYAQIWKYVYDRAGNQTEVIDPAGSVTKSVFSSTGRLTRKIENFDNGGSQERATDYEYQYGRLIAMRTDRTPHDPSDGKQRTLVVYGASIVDDGFNIVSQNNGLIGELRMPNENGGIESPPHTLSLRYNFAGQVAERIDARGCALRYRYDDQGRLSSVQVGHYITAQQYKNGYPPGMTPVTGVPADRVAYVEHTYHPRGHLELITNRAQAAANQPAHAGAIISQNRFDRDDQGNLIADWQSHGVAVNPSTSPRTEYEWEYTPAALDPQALLPDAGRTLLTKVLYPAHPGVTPRREISLDYRTSGSADFVLPSIAAMSSNVAPLAIADFEHIGLGRRARTELAGGMIVQNLVTADQGNAVGLAGLDALGRLKDLHYQNSASPAATLFRGRYFHDHPGNRSGVMITQAPVGGQSRDNTHSQVNRYDKLQRLIATDVGAMQVDTQTQLPIINPTTKSPQIEQASLVRADAWQLDLLGNWVGGAAAGITGPPGGWGTDGAPTPPSWVPLDPSDSPGRVAFGQLDAGIPGITPDAPGEYKQWTHTVNEQNETRLVDFAEGGEPPTSATSQEQWVRRDASGNVIYDGTYYYQYDAWNRLIQINLGIKTTTAPGTPAPGEPEPLPGELSFTVKPGLLVKHYSYDGLGRLIRTQSPWPDVQEGAVTKQVRSERFFYDGIRRIQELVTDPVLNKTAAMTTGDPGLIELAEAEGEILGENEEALEGEFVFDGDTTSLKLEDGQSAAQGGGTGGGGGGSYVLLTYLAREYIWGPGDSHAGVDELLVYFNHNRWAYWPLQDAGGDIVSVCDMGGTNPAGGNAARVCGQWRYDAYGAATASEHLAAFPQLHCGHKALFFDRLDIGVDPGAQGIEPPRLIPFAHLLVHMRNRAYSPQMGRFMQPDPNATAMTLIEAASYHGRGMDAMVAAFDMQGMYGDGMNLYEYLGSSPWGRSDPLGLSWDPFSMVDDFQAEHAASTAAFMSALGRSATATAVIAATIASYLPFPFVGNLGELALYALGETSETDLAMAMALGLVPGGKLAAKFSGLGSFIGKIGSSAWSTATSYARKLTSRFSRGGLAHRAQAAVKACVRHCFEAATEVWTARGLVPIEEIREGDLVIATDETNGELTLRPVTRTFTRYGAPIVAVTILLGGLHSETFATTEEHPFYVEGRGWVQSLNLQSGDVVRTLGTGAATGTGPVAEIGAVEFTSRLATVYNFEVEGLHNYRVGASGVLSHNGSPCDWHHAWPKFLVS